MSENIPLKEKRNRYNDAWGEKLGYNFEEKDVIIAIKRLKKELIMKNRNAPIVDKIFGKFK
tara:strand:+ start:3378 stop:3560 length:183 start_codon:yes stop_codon:yes gene_type:complete